ncbi:transcriptional regulator [Oscillibacter sp. CAG:241]|nr:transcriptional regulator [Oscillibacter sp. CAG:241]
MISTKGRYSIRILLDLAEHRSGGYIPMKEVAARQNISLKYIEKLMPALKTAGFIESVHGIGGGYRLAREPEKCTLWDLLQCSETCTLWDILQCSEGNLAPVSCLKDGAGLCARSAECRTLPVWEEYYRMTRDYFSGVTLADLMDTPQGDNYVI